MKHSTRQALTMVATVVGVSLGISLQRAAGLPFPPELAADAWPEWAVFMCVVYTCTSLCYGIVERVWGVRAIDLAKP